MHCGTAANSTKIFASPDSNQGAWTVKGQRCIARIDLSGLTGQLRGSVRKDVDLVGAGGALTDKCGAMKARNRSNHDLAFCCSDWPIQKPALPAAAQHSP
jgi:hypothetical protein